MDDDNERPPVSRPRTTTGQLRLVELMTHITSDAVWKRPRLAMERRDERDMLTVIDMDGRPGLAVAFFEGAELWAIVLRDEGFDDDGVVLMIDGEAYVPLGDRKPRWAERALLAQSIQERRDEVLASIPTLT